MRAVEIVEVPVDVHDAALSTSQLVAPPVSAVSKVTLIWLLKNCCILFFHSLEGCVILNSFYCTCYAGAVYLVAVLSHWRLVSKSNG